MEPSSAAAMADKLATAKDIQTLLAYAIGILVLVCGFLARELLVSFKERIAEGKENGRTAAQVAAALQSSADAQRLQAMKGAG